MTSNVLVTGGTGRLGRLVVTRLVNSGCNVRILARRHRAPPHQVTFFSGDLRTGEGIGPAVNGVEAIVHCATSTKGDVEATRNLAREAARVGSPHLIHPSIVGIDRVPAWGYTTAKLMSEQIVEESGLSWTILRVTQFYDYCFEYCQKLSSFPIVAPVPAGFHVQPIDPDEVAARLVEIALDGPAGRAPEMAGPQITSWVNLLRTFLAATHRRRWVIPVRIPGSKAVRSGALLPSPGHSVGSSTWEQFLSTRLLETPTAPSPDRPYAEQS